MPPVSNGRGGFTQPETPLSPATWRFAIDRASAKGGAAHFAPETISKATYAMNGRYHDGITTRTVIRWTDRGGTVHLGRVLDVDDTEGAGVETWILVSEVVQ
ncbi:MAG: hypothetical protein V4597_08580 [Pseudomonadota bacterium]